MKGIIVDLDNTLWGGIVGEISPEGVDIGGFYEQFQILLSKLASEGYLLGIASKNSLNTVKEVFLKRPLKVKLDDFFPIKVNYEEKSKSIREILSEWNILAKDVVFVDDRQFELEEVKRNHPDIKTVLVPEQSADYSRFFESIRTLFPKKSISKEDKLRLESIRSGVKFAIEEKAADPEEFHKSLNSEVIVYKGFTERAFELVNKTNQFTINGLRITEEDEEKIKNDERSVCYTFEYTDRFGPLGVVGVMMGFVEDRKEIYITHMSVSCRAFSRRLEYMMVDFLFRIGFERVHLLVLETASNEAARQFASNLFGKSSFSGFETLKRNSFEKRKPKLYQRVICHSYD